MLLGPPLGQPRWSHRRFESAWGARSTATT
nr:MAG TPA: hypothetical protein [Caudoviricetes sp.]